MDAVEREKIEDIIHKLGKVCEIQENRIDRLEAAIVALAKEHDNLIVRLKRDFYA
jgi:pyrroline-5-carboxylate reductase